ncbi:Molybdenum cofactor cytidylyltransferase [Salinivirga cyanobacteriivorans]|uniref:Molybdenum cofactor cytidylyltransferase n=1 Tax=Salinivirga cyanobacteriivorans TaxID=1307839 RepID=A0A0S2I2T8_9BACT|nr:NTP transferase domain-containing protein [Salinivirga cyanobacteriivorans]ALO16348.1 Molybdenum cofactor cytidylyltransferase [Salinivirga cyanobacteriivorans]
MSIFVLCCQIEYSFQEIMTKSTQKEKKYPAIIMAAGFSSRMGTQKMFLPFTTHECFLSRLIAVYESYGSKEVVLVVNSQGAEHIQKNFNLAGNIRIIKNPHPEWQKFYSLQLACQILTNTEAVFVQNIDNPFTNAEVLMILEKAAGKGDYILPEYRNTGGHPFLISSHVIRQVAEHQNPQEHLKFFLKQFKTLRLPVQNHEILANINTPEAYEQWFKKAL